ncbi:MAG: Abi family protein [Saccharofermentanales bacterium]|jgi:abortive infection bacteriophage resistance protein
MLKLKTFRTYREQIQFMRSRGIEVADEREATEALSTYSYYSLVNLNKHLYGGLNERQFIGNPSLLDLQLAHMLNMNFYQVVLKGILYIEASFKTKLAYLISRKFGVVSRDDITDPNGNFFYQGYYNNDSDLTVGTLRALQNKLRYLHSDANENSYSHKFLIGNQQLPPWMFVHDVEFGLAIQWYNILREQDKNEVCAKMIWGETGKKPKDISIDVAKAFFADALQVLREYRNTIAHGERVFPSEISNQLPETPLFTILDNGELTHEEYRQGIGTNDPYACLLCILLFIHDPILMLSFLTELQSQIDFTTYMQKTMSAGTKDAFEMLGLPNFTMDRLIGMSHDKFGEVSRFYFHEINDLPYDPDETDIEDDDHA